MYCPSCGSLQPDGVAFCGSCGNALNVKAPAPAVAATSAMQSLAQNENVGKVKDFFRNSFSKIFAAMFGRPVSGVHDLLVNARDEAFFQSMVLYATTAIAYVLLPWLVAGDARRIIPFDVFLKLGLAILVLLLVISVLTFLVKSITGKPDFKKELLTGALCGLPMLVLIVFVSLFALFGMNSSVNTLLNPDALFASGVWMGLVMLFVILMIVNIVEQSLRASGVNEALSWYGAPIIFGIAAYVMSRLVSGWIASSMYANPYRNPYLY